MLEFGAQLGYWVTLSLHPVSLNDVIELASLLIPMYRRNSISNEVIKLKNSLEFSDVLYGN